LKLKRSSSKTKVYGIGENRFGLINWDLTFKEQQKAKFRLARLKLAIKFNLPVVDSCQEKLLTMLLTLYNKMLHVGLTGIFHCFTGSLERGRKD